MEITGETTEEALEAAEEEASMTDQEKCTKQRAQSAAKNAKFHSSQQRESQSIAENALEQKGNSKRIRDNFR